MGACGYAGCNDPYCDRSTPPGFNPRWHHSVESYLVAMEVSQELSRMEYYRNARDIEKNLGEVKEKSHSKKRTLDEDSGIDYCI